MADKQLKEKRTKFVECVNSTVLKDLIDDMRDEQVFNDAEAESVTEESRITRDKARDLIDMVIKKGPKASEALISSIMNRDPNLSANMGLGNRRGEAGDSNVSHQETQIQPSATALQINEKTQISTQEMCSPKVENGITLCPLEVYNKIKIAEAGQIYDIKEKQCRTRLALVINNMQFDSLSERKGSEQDERGMTQLLQGLGYQVDIETDLSSQEMEASLRNFALRPEHEDSDSTFLVIMSHGLSKGICGIHHQLSKDDILPLAKIFEIFNNKNCSGLRWKPKVIIIQACRGEKDGSFLLPDSIDEAADACPVPSEKDLLSDSSQEVLLECDFLCFCSSTPDTISYRRVNTGSPFIQKLIEVMQNKAWNCCLEELFRKVQLYFKSGLQMPTKERVTAMKKFYLFPGH